MDMSTSILFRRRGIILAGGNGTRLYPITSSVSKQLLPIYDKPMIFYPLSTLMMADIRDILIITTEKDNYLFKDLLGNGDHLGINIKYAIQKKPNGIAQSLIIAEKFLKDYLPVLILGDNLFHGLDFSQKLLKSSKREEGATIFGYSVKDPERYGVIKMDKNKKVLKIIEKPKKFVSNYAVTGIYFYDDTAVERSKAIKPSSRGELEITDLNNSYIKDNLLNAELMSGGMAWLDTGTFDSLHEASSYVKILESRQGVKVGCPEELAWNKGWIGNSDLENIASKNKNNSYGNYLFSLLENL